MNLDKAFLGRSKDHLDEIDLQIMLDVPVTSFGAYVRYSTSQQSGPVEECMRVDAFQVMMSSQRQLCLQKLPQNKTEYNSKDRLYNSILDSLQEIGLDFSTNEVDNAGVNLVL